MNCKFYIINLAFGIWVILLSSCSRETNTVQDASAKHEGGEPTGPSPAQQPSVAVPSLAERVFGDKIANEVRKNQMGIDAPSVRALLGKLESSLGDNEFPGRRGDVIEQTGGDQFQIYAGPFSSTVSAVALKVRRGKVVAVNVTMLASGEGLTLKNALIGSGTKLGEVTTRMGGADLKGVDVKYDHYGENGSDIHVMIHEDQGMVNLIALDARFIPVAEAIPSLRDVPVEILKKIER